MPKILRGPSVLAALSMVFAGLLGLHVPASADVQPLTPAGTTRISGSDRYRTSAAISARSVVAPQDRVYLTSGQEFSDALAAGPIAGAGRDPILLVKSDALPEAISAELVRMRPAEVVILGGPVAINDAVETQVRRVVPQAKVRRIGGKNRWETAARIALSRGDAPVVATAPPTDGSLSVEPEPTPEGAPVADPEPTPEGTELLAAPTEADPAPVTGRDVIIASGRAFPDALVAGSAMASKNGTVLLTAPDFLPVETRDALTKLAPSSVTIVGGDVAINAAVESQIKAAAPGVPVTRVAGKNRYLTASLISKTYFGATPANVVVASGENFPDALSGTPLAAANQAPILLTRASALPSVSADHIKGAKSVVVLGGTSVASLDLAPPPPPPPPPPAPKPAPVTGSYGTLIPGIEYVATRRTPIRLTASTSGKVLATVDQYELMKTTSTAYNYSTGQKWWKVRFQGKVGYINRADIIAAGAQPLMVYGTLRTGQPADHVFDRFSHSRVQGTVPKLELWMTKNHSVYTWWPWAIPGTGGLVGEALYFSSSVQKSALAQADKWEGVDPVGDPAYQNYMRDMELTSRGNKVWVYVATDWREAQARRTGTKVPSGDYTRF